MRKTVGLVAMLSLAQSVSRGGAGAPLQKATQHSAGQQHSISVSLLTGKMGLFGRKDTLQGKSLSRRGKNPPDGGDEKPWQRFPAYVHSHHASFPRTNISGCYIGNDKTTSPTANNF